MSVCLHFAFFTEKINIPQNTVTKFHVSLYPLASGSFL